MAIEPVAAGSRWLDEHVPGWEQRIDLETLDVTNCTMCVLGQVYGDFIDGLKAAGKHWSQANSPCDADWPFRNGFAVGNTEQGWMGREELNAEWRAEIERRKADS